MMSISDKSFATGYIENNHPAFLIIPFRNEDIYNNASIACRYSFDLESLLEERYPNKHIVVTYNARKALSLVLDQMTNTTDKSVVRIQTTSDNFYISGCVTKTIEKENLWHRDKKENSDIVLVNHEFGYADNRVLESTEEECHLIEDCAFAFDTKLADGKRCGQIAPYSVFSFSKFFPIQIGGCLMSDNPVETLEDESAVKYIENVVGYYFDQIPEWSEKRLEAFKYYTEVFAQLGCKPTFNRSDKDIPGVYLFDLPELIDAQKLKEYYWTRGIQCSVFYGRKSFYLPLNQFTKRWHIEYFADIFRSFQLQKHE